MLDSFWAEWDSFQSFVSLPGKCPRHHEQIPTAKPAQTDSVWNVETLPRWNHSKYQSRSSVSRIRLEITGFGSRFEVASNFVDLVWGASKRTQTRRAFELCVADRSETWNRRRNFHGFHASSFRQTFNCICIVRIWWTRWFSESRLQISRKDCESVVSSIFSWKNEWREFSYIKI